MRLNIRKGMVCAVFVHFIMFGFLTFSPAIVPVTWGQEKKVVVGCTLPMTGVFSSFGRYFVDAYRYWETEVNEQGGLLGHKVSLIIYDDKSDAATCSNLYQKLITVDKVNFIVAGFPTAVHMPIMALAEKYKMVMINGGSNSSRLIDKGRYKFTFTVFCPDKDWAKPMFDFLTTLPPKQRPKKVGFILKVDAFQQGITNAMNDYAKEKGFEVFGTESFTIDTQDQTPMVEKFKEANVDFLFSANQYATGLALLRTVAERGYKPKAIYVTVGPTVPQWIEDLGSRTDNVFTTTVYWHSNKFDGNDSFVAGIKKHYGYLPTRESGLGYGALQVLGQAVRKAKTFDQIKLRDFIRANTFETVLGTQKFDELGYGNRNAWLMQVQGPKLYPVYPESIREANPVYPRP